MHVRNNSKSRALVYEQGYRRGGPRETNAPWPLAKAIRHKKEWDGRRATVVCCFRVRALPRTARQQRARPARPVSPPVRRAAAAARTRRSCRDTIPAGRRLRAPCVLRRRRPYADAEGGVDNDAERASATGAPWYPRTRGGPVDVGGPASSGEPASSEDELRARRRLARPN
jgi:hypothetical protein